MPDHADKFPKQAVGVFSSPQALEDAIDRLEQAKFDHERISVVGMQHVLEGKLKHVHSVTDLTEAHAEVQKTAPIRHVEMNEMRTAAIGFPAYAGAIGAGVAAVTGGLALPVIVATISGAAGGALLGAIFTSWLSKKRADYYAEQVAHGGILLWVTLDDEEDERKVKEILPDVSIEPVKILASKG